MCVGINLIDIRQNIGLCDKQAVSFNYIFYMTIKRVLICNAIFFDLTRRRRKQRQKQLINIHITILPFPILYIIQINVSSTVYLIVTWIVLLKKNKSLCICTLRIFKSRWFYHREYVTMTVA